MGSPYLISLGRELHAELGKGLRERDKDEMGVHCVWRLVVTSAYLAVLFCFVWCRKGEVSSYCFTQLLGRTCRR